jgi:hypothetical protein
MARILYIGIDFYDYAARISGAFERLGHTVDFRAIEDRGFAAKSAKKLAGGLYTQRLRAYHRALIEESRAQRYDIVLFIQVHQFAHDELEALRAAQPQARFVLYNWDSLTTHDYRPYLRHFDHVATFDPEDARAVAGVAYLPLFAIPRFFEIDRAREPETDLYFIGAIGSMHRFDALARLHAFCDGAGLSTHFHLVCSPLVKARLWRTGRKLPGVTGQPIDFEAIIAILQNARATFDFANHRQSGYTMRLIENMCAGVKIVTENPRIVTERFYREDRFLLIDGEDFSGVPEFLARPITSQLDVREFHVDNWARALIKPAGAKA